GLRVPDRGGVSMKIRRGFTMIEVAISIALGAIVVGSVVLVLQQVIVSARRQHILSELQRDGAYAGQVMTQELRQAGVGVPIGFMLVTGATGFDYGTGAVGTGNNLVFPARRLIVAGNTEIGFIGDIARPDSNYN